MPVTESSEPVAGRADGIFWLASYPKSGNTWLGAFVSNLIIDGDAPGDVNRLAIGEPASSSRWIERVLAFDTQELDAEEVERLRPEVYRWSLRSGGVGYHKIHDAYTFTEDGEPLVSREATLGVLYIVRNPLDVVLSAADYWNLSIDQTIDVLGRSTTIFDQRGVPKGHVRQRLLSWSEHARSWLDVSGVPGHVIRYEDMSAKPSVAFAAAARFLRLPDHPARVEKAVRFSSFEELSRQERERGFHLKPGHAERFFRRGRAGGWRADLSPAQIERIIADHGEMMRRFGYLDGNGTPV